MPRITPNDGGAGGTFDPPHLDLGPGETGQFVYYAPRAGLFWIATTNDGGLADPPPLPYTASDEAPAMSIQASDTVLNAALDAWETAISTAPTLEVRTGSPPANCAAADSGTVLATMTLPSDWMAAAATHAKAKSGTWNDTSADASGTPGHFRIKQSTTTHMQGTAAVTSGGDLNFDATISLGGVVTITSFTLTAANT